MENTFDGPSTTIPTPAEESIEDRMLRQILEESLRQTQQDERNRHEAAEARFKEQLRAANDQNAAAQRRRDEQFAALQAQEEEELNRQIAQAIEENRIAEEERVKKRMEETQRMLDMDRGFGGGNRGQAVGRSNTVVGLTGASTSNSGGASVQGLARSNTLQSASPSPSAGSGTGIPAPVSAPIEPFRNAPVASAANNVPVPNIRAPVLSSTVPPSSAGRSTGPPPSAGRGRDPTPSAGRGTGPLSSIGRGTGTPAVSLTQNAISTNRPSPISTPTAASRMNVPAPIYSSPLPSPSVAPTGDRGAERLRPTSTPIVSTTANQPDISRSGPARTSPASSNGPTSGPISQVPTYTPSVSSRRNTQGSTNPNPSRSSTVSSLETGPDNNRQAPARSSVVEPEEDYPDPFAPGVVGPFFLALSSWQTGNGGQDQQPGQSRRESRPENGGSPITDRSDSSRWETSSSTVSRNWSIGPVQGEPIALNPNNERPQASDRIQIRSPSPARSIATPSPSQLSRSVTLPSGNRDQRRNTSRAPDPLARVNGSRTPSLGPSLGQDQPPNQTPSRTQSIHERSLSSVPSRRSTVNEGEAPGPWRRFGSEYRRTPRTTAAQPAGPLSQTLQNQIQSASSGSGTPQRSTTRSSTIHVPNENGQTPVNIDSGRETVATNGPSASSPESAFPWITDNAVMARALRGSLTTEDLAAMTDEQQVMIAMRGSAEASTLQYVVATVFMTDDERLAHYEAQMAQASGNSLADDLEIAEWNLERVMSDIPKYGDIVGTWYDWNEKKNGVAPDQRLKREPRYGVPSGSKFIYATSFAADISLERALIVSNRGMKDYWSRVRKGEITEESLAPEFTADERRAKGEAQMKHIKSLGPTQQLDRKFAEESAPSQEAGPSEGNPGPTDQGGEGAASGSAEGPVNEVVVQRGYQSINKINAQRDAQRRGTGTG